MGIADRVFILGYRDDIENVYATLDVMLNCSTSEGMPLTIIEAMHCGIPVIATAVGGNAEVIVHEKTGFLISGDDIDGMAGYIKDLSDKDLRAEMGEAAKERALKHFTAAKNAESYWKVFNEYIIRPEKLKCSIVMPAWNAADTIMRAIDSIQLQTLGAYECIIVDDGSDDNTREIVADVCRNDERFRLLHQPHSGIVPALNRGVGAANTELIVRMDADDMMVPDRLENQVLFMESSPDIDVLGGQMVCVLPDGRFVSKTDYPLTHDAIKEQMFHRNPLGHPATCYRKKAFESVNGYRGDGRAEDLLMWMDMMIAGFRFANMPEIVLRHTLSHDGDAQYGEWVHSILPEAQEAYKLAMTRQAMGVNT
jgi:hypothetical protein